MRHALTPTERRRGGRFARVATHPKLEAAEIVIDLFADAIPELTQSRYLRMSPERRAEVIEKASANVAKRRADARKLGMCICGGWLRVIVTKSGTRLGARCQGCEDDRKERRECVNV